MDLSLEKLKQAVSLREQIDVLEARINALFGVDRGQSNVSSSAGSAPTATGRPRRRMSAATRAKLSAAATARWARRNSGSGNAAPAPSASKRRGGITAAGRKKLSDAMKARWAERRRAAGRK